MAFSIRDQIERDRILRKYRQPDRIYKAVGSRCVEGSSGHRVFYCPTCKGPVVDSERGRYNHAQRSPRCKAK